MELVLTKRYGKPDSHLISTYEADGGYEIARKALATDPDEIIEEVKKANLRGRGGAGFPAGIKWGFMPKDKAAGNFLCVNSDESEPGTFKDHTLLMNDPHQLIEGIIIACHAMRCENSIVYIRGEMWDGKAQLNAAIVEAREKGYLGKNIFGTENNLHLYVATGAGAYICGEETAMLNSIEGRRGEPRLKPPFPAQVGAFGKPTTVNNVETISNIPHIIRNGGDWFAGLGVAGDGGTRLYGISGPVKKPGIYELPQGTNMKYLIEEVAGGMIDGKKLQAVIPGGSSCSIVKAEEIDVPHCADGLKEVGSTPGTGGMIVIPEDYCIVKALYNLTHFYSHESCGQCTPCREGTNWLHLLTGRIERGEAEMSDIDQLYTCARNMMGVTICALSDAAATPVVSYIEKYREKFEEHVKLGRCPLS